MSLILDALRKMEQERKARRHTTADIRPEVLSYRGVPAKPQRSGYLVPAAVTSALVLLCAGGWLLLKSHDVPQAAAERPAAPRSATPELPQPVATPLTPAAINPSRSASPSPSEPVSPPPAVPSAPVAAKSAPDSAASSGIMVSGIAWQDERILRRAVVNGNLVGEGAEVAGARITEIRETSILFTRNGQSFEVSGSTGR